MESADPIVPPQATQSTVATESPAVSNPGGSEQNSSSKKMVIMLIVGMIVVLAIVGGIYYFLSRQQSAEQPKTAESTTAAPTKTPLAQVKDALDLELEAINVSASDSDFQTIDTDLQKL